MQELVNNDVVRSKSLELNQNSIESLKKILLEEERKHLDELDISLFALKQDHANDAKLDTRVRPMVKQELKHFKDELGPEVTKALKKQIDTSKEELIQALAPIMGRLIKAYLKVELEAIMEKIDAQMGNVLSFDSVKSKFKSAFSKSKPSEILIGEGMRAVVEEVFLIENKTGLEIGKYSKYHTLDSDLISAMMSAIKSFVETAFQKSKNSKDSDLQIIEYGQYKILASTYYQTLVVVVVSGIINAQFKSNLSDKLNDFAEENLSFIIGEVDNELNLTLSNQLKIYFDE